MRDFRRNSRIAALAFTGSALLLATQVAIYGWYDFDAPTAPGSTVTVTILSVLMLGMIVLGVIGGMEAFEAQRFGRLARGEGVIARWTIDAQAWRQRVAERRLLDAQPGVRPTSFIIDPDAPAGDVEIVVSNDAVFVGPDAMQPLFEEFGIGAHVQDSWLEFDWDDNDSGFVVRVPIAPGAEAVAGMVVLYFGLAGK